MEPVSRLLGKTRGQAGAGGGEAEMVPLQSAGAFFTEHEPWGSWPHLGPRSEEARGALFVLHVLRCRMCVQLDVRRVSTVSALSLSHGRRRLPAPPWGEVMLITFQGTW